MQKAKNTKWYINSAITLCIMLLFPLLPNIGSITDIGMQILGIIVGMLYGWCFVELAWPSIVGLLLFGSLEGYTINGIFGSAFGNPSVILCLVFFGFSKMLEELNVTNFIAARMLALKFARKNPWRVVLLVFMVSYILALLIDIFPAIFLTWALALSVTDLSGYKRNEPVVAFLLSIVIFSSTLGGLVLPFKSSPIIIGGILTATTGLTIESTSFLIFNLLITLLSIVLLFVVSRFLLKIDISRLALTEETIKMYGQKGTKEQKLGLALVLVFIIVLLLAALLPASIPVIAFLKNWGTLGVCLILMFIPAVLKNEKDEAWVNIRTMMTGVGWDFFWLLCAIMTMANLVNVPETGIMNTVSSAFVPILEKMPSVMTIVLAGLITCVISQFVVNIVVVAVFIPIFIPFCISIGIDPMLCFYIMYITSNIAFATPAASMPAALMHGQENIESKQAYFYGALFMIIGLGVTLLVGIPFGSIIL